jgi:hypothetical protein
MKEKYKYGGHTCIRLLTTNGEPYTTLSLNIPEAKRKKGEFFVRNYDENEGLDDLRRYGGAFEDTGKKLNIGWCTVPVWRLAPNH